MQISVITSKHKTELFKAYEKEFNSREEFETFYGRFIQNGWVSGALKNEEFVGVLTWAPREAVIHKLAEVVDFWVKAEERRKGIGGKLIDHALLQMQRYHGRFGSRLDKAMVFTGASDDFLAARNLYEKRGFRVVATIPKNALDNPYGDDLLYVLQIPRSQV